MYTLTRKHNPRHLSGILDTIATAYTADRQASAARDERKAETAIAQAQIEAEKAATERAIMLANSEQEKIAAQLKLAELEKESRAILIKDVGRVAVPVIGVGALAIYLLRRAK